MNADKTETKSDLWDGVGGGEGEGVGGFAGPWGKGGGGAVVHRGGGNNKPGDGGEGTENNPRPEIWVGKTQPQGWGQWLGFPSPGAVLRSVQKFRKVRSA